MDSTLANGFKTPKIILSFLSVLLFSAGCDELSHKSLDSESNRLTALWINEATAIAQKIPADIHGVERDRTLTKVAVTAAEKGLSKQTEEVVESLTSWHKGGLYARLARICYLDNRHSEGDKLLDAARRTLEKSDYEDWQRSRIKLAIEQANLAQGRECDPSTVAGLDTADQAKLLPGLVQHNVTHSNLVTMLEHLEASTNQVMDIDSASGVVDTYLVLYQTSKLDDQTQYAALSDRILQGIDSVFRSLHAAIACEKLVDFCNAAWDADDHDFAIRLSTMAAQRLSALRADMRLPVQLRYADFLVRADLIAQAMRQVEGVVDGIDDTSVMFSDRPALLVECGVLSWNAGEQSRALQLFRRAVQDLNLMKNSRPRAVATVDVILLLARNEINAPEIMQAVSDINRELNAPW